MPFSSVLGQLTISVLMKVASGIEKNTPQNPHRPPKIKIADKIEKASKFMAFEKSNGVNTLLSKICITI